MAIHPIVSLPDPVLRRVSQPLERIDSEVERLLDDMLETMRAAPGIGLAAVQIGQPLRLVVVELGERAGEEADSAEDEAEAEPPPPPSGPGIDEPLFMVNPKIVRLSSQLSARKEGCLSIPDYFAEVERPASCAVEYMDRQGERRLLEADGLMAACIQHEIDHLDGILFIDRLSRLRRDMVIRKFSRIARREGQGL